MSQTANPGRAASESDRPRSDLAALRFQTALVRIELKYRPNQPRKPKGPGGGQFSKDLDAALGMLRETFAHAATDLARDALSGAAALNDMERGTMAGVAKTLKKVASVPLPPPKLPVMTLANVNGELVVSPYVLPAPLLDMHPPVLLKDTGGGREPVPQGKFDEECEEQLKKDDLDCDIQAAMCGRLRKRKNQIRGACKEQAFQRYSECLLGGVSAIRSPRFDGRQSFPSRRN